MDADKIKLTPELLAIHNSLASGSDSLSGVGAPAGWISVADRLPAPGAGVLLTVRDVSAIPGPDYKESFWVTRGQRDVPSANGSWLWRDGAAGSPSYHQHQITHWQPLPAPAR